MDEVFDGLKVLAKEWSEDIRNKANKNLGKYKNLIRVSARVTYPKDRISISAHAENIARDEYGDVKRVARAYEYGSGIHGKENSTYEIRPRRKKVLAFSWDVLNQALELEGIEGVKAVMQYSGKFVGIGSETDERGYPKYLFRYVDHPGVEAANGGAGYLRPAIESTRRRIRKEVPPEIRKKFIKRFKKSFGGRGE